MSNIHTPGSGSGASHNGNSFVSRREARASNATGALPPLETVVPEHSYHGSFDFEQMVQSLHDLFERDRQVASQADSTRCGVCYLHFTLSELHYQEEGFYICENCERVLGNHKVPMLRKQQKM